MNKTIEPFDAKYMRLAITLAKRGVGKTSPNPAVGCVIVKNNKIVGKGWHKKAGTAHAEINALTMAGEAAKGADLYVTLEPCCHHGATPPCTDALIAAGVRRVMAGMVDPNPLVAGKGLQILQKAGIHAASGLLEADCRKLNPGFIKFVTKGLPYLTYKTAMSLDGVIATATGHSHWVTGDCARKEVHRLRAIYDAVMVGVNTLLADNPKLTVRHVRGRNPLRIVLDSSLRTPLDAVLLNDGAGAETIIATLVADQQQHQPYMAKGAKVLVCAEKDGQIDPHDLLIKLADAGVRTILLEGGGCLAGSLLKTGLIDEFIFFCAPKIVGADGYKPFAALGIEKMDQAFHLKIVEQRMVGQDLMIKALPEAVCLQA